MPDAIIAELYLSGPPRSLAPLPRGQGATEKELLCSEWHGMIL